MKRVIVLLLYVTIQYFCSSSPVTHLKILNITSTYTNRTIKQRKPMKQSLFHRFVNQVFCSSPWFMINIDAFLFLDDFIKLTVGSECPHTFPGWMIPFKASEINIKPAHNSLRVWGGGGVRKVTILSSILGLGRTRWRRERAHKRPYRKSLPEPGPKFLTSLIPTLTPGSREQNQQMSPSYPLNTPCFICNPLKVELVLSHRKLRFMAEMGKLIIALQVIGCDHWRNKGVGEFCSVLLSQYDRWNLRWLKRTTADLRLYKSCWYYENSKATHKALQMPGMVTKQAEGGYFSRVIHWKHAGKPPATFASRPT